MHEDRLWAVYAQRQGELARRDEVNHRTWGLEAGLDRLLERGAPTEDEADRAARSRGRRERYQRALLREALRGKGEPPVDAVADARCQLHLLRGLLVDDEMALVAAVAVGVDPIEFAQSVGAPPGRIRVQLHRVRRRLADALSVGGLLDAA